MRWKSLRGGVRPVTEKSSQINSRRVATAAAAVVAEVLESRQFFSITHIDDDPGGEDPPPEVFPDAFEDNVSQSGLTIDDAEGPTSTTSSSRPRRAAR